MTKTPLTDAYLAARCEGEETESWADFARRMERMAAAAPDLLAACEAMANAPIQLTSSGFPDVDEERRNALKQIRAAIKKARGD